MSTLLYSIEFYGYWHIGSGLSGSTYADALVNKDQADLPFIPGKTLKGLLRDAAIQINSYHPSMVSEEFILNVFGDSDNPSTCFFSNATVSEKIHEEVKKKSGINLISSFYKVQSSTKIDINGQAEDQSLRQIEVTIPIKLYAQINNFNTIYLEEIKNCLQWIKQMGVNRNRGLGKCTLKIVS